MLKDIEIINENSNIAISTLWLKKEFILKQLPEEVKNKICIIGTTYTSYGLNFILETLGNFNNIDTLIVYGADLSTSGDTLKKAFGEKNLENLKLLFEKEKILEIIKTVKLIDLREYSKRGKIEKLIEEIEKNYKLNTLPPRNKIKLTIEEKIELESNPLPLSGHYIYENKSVFRAWIKILDLIMKFGSIKFSEQEIPQKEYLNLTVTLGLYGKNYKIEEEFFEFIDAKNFEKHISEVLYPQKPEGVEYSYGERFFKHRFGKNQIEYLIEKLVRAPYSRRALVISWDHEKDQSVENPPCIIGVQGIITDNFYNHTVFIRSNDMFKAWPLNFIAQIELAKYIVNEINKRAKTNFEIGTITSISTSAHIYQNDWEFAKKVLDKYYYKISEFIEDPKGNFLIYLNNDKVVVEHRTFDNLNLIFKVEGNKFWEIYNALKNENSFSTSLHAFYLGKELAKAFEKLSKNEKYIQDHV